MKQPTLKPYRFLIGFVLASVVAGGAQQGPFATVPATGSVVTTVTPAQQAIARAQAAVERNHGRAEDYDNLALALARRARETSDGKFYAQAEDAIQKARAVAADDFGAGKAETAVLLGRHEYAAALALAQKLNKRLPDEVSIYGYLVDANTALGNYDAAENAANWMLRLRPGNTPALIRAAELREVYGMIPGATDLLATALQATPFAESEERAWLMTELARLNRMQGRLEQGEQLASEALTSFPDYDPALAELAQARMALGRYDDAIKILRARTASGADATRFYDLAAALDQARKKEESRKVFAEFESRAKAESSTPLNANRQLIFYYADYAGRPADAVAIAQREVAIRHDVYTLDAYGWALFRAGQVEEARRQVERSLLVGVHDAEIFSHASQIAFKQGDTQAGEKYLKLAKEFEVAGPAKGTVAQLSQ